MCPISRNKTGVILCQNVFNVILPVSGIANRSVIDEFYNFWLNQKTPLHDKKITSRDFTDHIKNISMVKFKTAVSPSPMA